MTKRKKKKFNFKRIFSLIIFIIIVIISCKYILNIRTKNIIILNNNYYSDEYIIEESNIQDYPKFLLLNTSKIRNKLLKNDLIEDVKITKKWGSILEINIKEKKVLYYVRSNGKYVTSDGNSYKLDKIDGIPTLINYVTTDVEKEFIKKFGKLDSSVISLISEIEYNPNEYDQKRFRLYMNDGNMVYITIPRMDLLNKYVSIVKQLNNKNGILYLDSGNYFKIEE